MCDGMARQVRLLAHLDQLEAAGVVFRMAYVDAETRRPKPADFKPHTSNWSSWDSAFCVIPPAEGMEDFTARVLSDDEYYADLFEALKVKTLGYGWWVKVCGDDDAEDDDLSEDDYE